MARINKKLLNQGYLFSILKYFIISLPKNIPKIENKLDNIDIKIIRLNRAPSWCNVNVSRYRYNIFIAEIKSLTQNLKLVYKIELMPCRLYTFWKWNREINKHKQSINVKILVIKRFLGKENLDKNNKIFFNITENLDFLLDTEIN